MKTRKQIFIIIWGALAIHLIQAMCILWYPDNAIGAIDVAAILVWIPIEYAPAALISTSGLALIGLLDTNIPWTVRLITLLPQQAFLSLAAFGVITAIIHGSYADGTIKPAVHIFNDQLWLLGYFFLHIYSVTRRVAT